MTPLTQMFSRQSNFRAYFWAALMASIYISIILSPIRIFDLLPSDLGLIPYSILSVPMILSFVMMGCYRNRSERIVAWFAFVFSAVQMMLVGGVRG